MPAADSLARQCLDEDLHALLLLCCWLSGSCPLGCSSVALCCGCFWPAAVDDVGAGCGAGAVMPHTLANQPVEWSAPGRCSRATTEGMAPPTSERRGALLHPRALLCEAGGSLISRAAPSPLPPVGRCEARSSATGRAEFMCRPSSPAGRSRPHGGGSSYQAQAPRAAASP